MRNLMVCLAVSTVFALPMLAQAQDNGSWDKIVLEDANGNVMTSTGGDYATASVGDQLAVGQHLMLAGNTPAAKLVYYRLDDQGNVKSRCVKNYTQANTYIVDANCTVAGVALNSSIGVNAAIIAGAALVGAAMIGSQDNTPISTGSL